jgi:glycosyltransferase involved in cell wall biosynthesis
MTPQRGAGPGPDLPDQERLRAICWDLGARFPIPFAGDHISFATVHPRLGYVHWHVRESSVERLRTRQGDAFHGSVLVVRIYDVTDIIFDGFNAHAFFDSDVGGLSGSHYLAIHKLERDLMAKIGFRLRDGAFHALARSNTAYFDRDRPSGKFHLGGLYVGRDFQRVFPIENVMDAPVFERLNYELAGYERQTPLAVAVIHTGLDPAADFGARLVPSLDEVAARCAKFHVKVQRFGDARQEGTGRQGETLSTRLAARSEAVFAQIAAHHRQKPFDLVHCHDWHAVPAGLKAAEHLGLPLVLSLHSTEYERPRDAEMQDEADMIHRWEKKGIDTAGLVIVPHSSTRQQIISLYEADADKVVIIPDIFEEQPVAFPDPSREKRNLHLNPEWPVVLFAGEISHAAGADLLMDALIVVCNEKHEVQFVFAGEGPLKDELQGRAWHTGLAHRCRFLGDISADWFERILVASDFVVIPARTWQDEGLAQMVTAYGKPVLTTHQSHIHCIEHGQNGFLTYDNPGSIVWGLKELLANPLQGNMLRSLAKQKAAHTQSLESVAAEHYIAYEKTLANAPGVQGD